MENSYSPFDLLIKPLEREGTPNHRFTYNGKELEENTAWYDYDARQMDAQIGRFTSIDPLAEKYMPISPYAYVANNPVIFIDPDGRYFVNVNGKKVSIRKRKNGKLRVGLRASADLRYLIKLVNNSGSQVAIDQVYEASQNASKIHVNINREKQDENPFLLGLHQAHDKNGEVLSWNKENEVFTGEPAYIEGEQGVYKEATITIYLHTINALHGEGLDKREKEKETFHNIYPYRDENGDLKAVEGPMTFNQKVASVFQHETHHNTDREYISNLRRKMEGKSYNKRLNSHTNISKKDRKVLKQMHDKHKKR